MPGEGKPAPEECPVCGEPLRPHFHACPECGASHDTGWQDDEADADFDPGLEEDDLFDYDAFLEREFGMRNRRQSRNRKWLCLLAALLILALILSRVVRV